MRRLLVVDDNPDILEILQIAFEARGFEVLTIPDGEQVIKFAETFKPDVILLDVFLGTVNGIDICNELKSKPETKEISIVMFSAHSKSDDVLKLCSAEAFIGKPFNIFHLTEVIESHAKN